MPYSFNAAPVAPGDNLQGDPAIWNQHLAAIQERVNLVDSAVTVGDGAHSVVASGSDLQTAKWWNYIDPVSYGSHGTAQFIGMQAAIAWMIGQQAWIDTTIEYEGYATPLGTDFRPIQCSFASLRNGGSLPAMQQLDSGQFTAGAYPDNSAFPSNSSWQRKRPREMFLQVDQTSATDTYDSQGNAATAGQLAWHGDGLGTLLYECVSSGTWQRHESGSPDLLDNANGFPDTITVSTGVPFVSSAIINAPGFSTMVNPGDYLGSWLFAEVRAVVNLMRWQTAQVIDNGTSYSGQATSTVSYADALTQLAASWGPGGTSAGFMCSYVDASYDAGAGMWIVYAERRSQTAQLGIFSPLPANPKQIDLYLYGDVSTSHSPPATNTFDAQGDPVINGQYHLIETSSITSATSVTLTKVGDETTLPPNMPPDPATSGDSRLGYAAVNALAVIRFDVAGGLAYLF